VTRCLAAIAALVLATSAAGCDSSDAPAKPAGKREMKFPVETRAVEARAVEYTVNAVGTLDVAEKVQITARVAGAVEKVGFREGDVVKQGAQLVAIDPARFGLAARQAAAGIASAKAALADAEAGLARRTAADKTNPGLIPGEEIATWRTKVATAQADLQQREVARDQAALDLRDAYVKAPIAGEIQSRSVDTGQYVAVGTVLATMVRRDPLQLRFKVSEVEAARFGKAGGLQFTVGGGSRSYHAVIRHIAAVADPASRMVDITAEVDDPDRAGLQAGGFAQVAVPVGTATNAPVVPESAVRPSERGFLAYVVEDGVARERIVELGLRTADGLVEIKAGLAVGDQVVVRGAEALRDGAAVRTGVPVPGERSAGSARHDGSAGAGSGSAEGSARR
jgi:multidrug efflux system membrane fusion protein